MVTEARRCSKCLAYVRAADRFCSFCHSPLPAVEAEQPPEPTAELTDPVLADFTLPALPDTTGQAQVLAAWSTALGVEPELIEEGFAHLHGVARFTLGDQLVFITLGFSELGAALYAYDESGLGLELVARVEGSTPPDDLFAALDAVREHQGTTSQPPHPLRYDSPWNATFTPSPTLEAIDTINGRVRFFEVRFERRPGVVRPAAQRAVPAALEPVAQPNRRSRSLDPAALEAREAELRVLRVAHARAAAPELEQAFAARRDEHAAQVYADWLQAHGDVRGVLASLQRAGDLRDDWLEANQQALLGDLKFGEQVRGFSWHHGFLDGASLRGASRWVLKPEEGGPPLHELTRRFLALPFAHFVRRLRFGVPSRQDVDWARTLAEVTRSAQAPSVLELRFDDYTFEDNELSWTPFGDFSAAWPKLPSLELLHVRSGEGGTLGFLDLPNLRTFIRESGGLAATELADVHRARWPRLERLDLWTGQAAYGAQATVEDVDRLLNSDAHPRLRHFGLVNCEFVHDAIPTIARSRLLPQLRRLDLSMGVLTDEDVPMLLQHAAALRHLEVLDLSKNLLGPAAKQLESLCAKVLIDPQRYEPYDDGQVDRYTAVGE